MPQAAVVPREDVPWDKRLAAYVRPRDDVFAAAEPHAFARQSLPDDMVPAAFVLLLKLPTTRNGKLKPHALPVPGLDSRAPAGGLPRTPIESALARAMAGALNLNRIGIDDSFLDLGGHSPSAVRLTGRIRDAPSVNPSLRQLLATPAVRGLAQAAADSPAARATDRPLSPRA